MSCTVHDVGQLRWKLLDYSDGGEQFFATKDEAVEAQEFPWQTVTWEPDPEWSNADAYDD